MKQRAWKRPPPKGRFKRLNRWWHSESYYVRLGIRPDADADAINAAFRKLALRYHPDHNLSGSEIFLKIREAHQALKDPGRRADHDRHLKALEEKRKEVEREMLSRLRFPDVAIGFSVPPAPSPRSEPPSIGESVAKFIIELIILGLKKK